MGCGGSRDSAGNSPASANHVIYDRKPKISVRIGDEVQRHNGSPTVIFIFGKSCFLALLYCRSRLGRYISLKPCPNLFQRFLALE